ncbi:hypothetical protein ACFE04_020081 [Oxalis oulophora]
MKVYQILVSTFLVFIIQYSTETESSIDFLFNGFNSTSSLLFYGNATLQSHHLTLTTDSQFSIGRTLYGTKIPTKNLNSSLSFSFSTSFIFSISPPPHTSNNLAGHGFVFLFTPHTGIADATSAQHLGFLNFSNNGDPGNHLFGIEFDVFRNEELNDINDNHVGIDVNSLSSVASYRAGYWSDNSVFNELKLNNGENYRVWVDYADSLINVTMVKAGMKRPKTPLLNYTVNLSDVFQDEMFVGFTASTGRLVQTHRILAWSFSDSNFSFSDGLITKGLPSFKLVKSPVFKSIGFITGVVIGGLFVIAFGGILALVLIRRKQRRDRQRANMEDWELEYWPHRIKHQDIEAATKNFAEENVIGIGGNGKVYKGVIAGGTEIAVKHVSQEFDGGMRAFLAEISSLGRLKHRNLVGLRGWCKREKKSFMLVYDYMENGSLDKRVSDCDDMARLLSCEERIRILKDVAAGVLYLHEGWEVQVLHRDIKASNVLLDKEMNGRLGDFGLARMHDHGQVPTTTRVVGTVGYMAPEVVRSGRSSAQTDVFGFGILILEVMCGLKPIEEGQPPLVDRVWQLMVEGELLDSLDTRLRVRGGYNEEEVEKVLYLGLLCAYPDPSVRPSMRQVVKILEGNNGELYEADNEEMDAILLQNMNSRDLWLRSRLQSYYGSTSHPTFEEIRESHSSSISLSLSDTILDGR